MPDTDPVLAGLLGDLNFAAGEGNGSARERAAALKLRLNVWSSVRKLAEQNLAKDSRDVADWKAAMREIAALCTFSEPASG